MEKIEAAIPGKPEMKAALDQVVEYAEKHWPKPAGAQPPACAAENSGAAADPSANPADPLAVVKIRSAGTMFGWKRIVVTVGEKMGKEHLTYAQGACAELVAMASIFAADNFGLPVSTTHVLSSGVAGTIAANRSGL